MSSTLILVITCIILLLLIAPLLFFVRRVTDISLEGDVLVIRYPLSTKKIDLTKEMEHWKVQEAYFLRWGTVYSINMMLKNGKQKNISSLFNQRSYGLLYSHLEKRFKNRRKPD